MFICEIWGKLTLFIPNFPPKHVITSTNFLQDKALLFRKIKILNQISFSDTGLQASKLCQNFAILKI